jgi:hypothetical protein
VTGPAPGADFPGNSPFGSLADRYSVRANPSLAIRWKKPSQLARELEPARKQTPALDLMDEEIIKAAETPDYRLIWSMPPQEGKSEGLSHYGLLWLLKRNPDMRAAMASYEGESAARWGRAIRSDILTFNGQDGQTDIGLRLKQDSTAVGRWQLEGYKGGIYSVGVGGALTGRPVDFLVIDDPIKGRAEADSIIYRDRAWDWWQNVARTRLAPGAPVILILTRWHEDDLAGRLIEQDREDDRLGIPGPRWKVVNIPAQAGPNDILGREEGEYLESTRGRTPAAWEAIKRDVGPRVWGALYQGNPKPVEGNLFKRAAINNNRVSLIEAPKMVTVREYIDPAFSDEAEADETGRVVMGLGQDGNAYVLADLSARKAYDRMELGSSHATHGTTGVRIEQNLLGKRVLSAVRGIVPDHVSVIGIPAKGTKAARAEAASNMVDNNRVKFVGKFPALEDQMCGWNPKDADSPDRMDAFVHGVRDLLIEGGLHAGFPIDGDEEPEEIARVQGTWAERVDPNLPDFGAELDPDAGKTQFSPFAVAQPSPTELLLELI